jgi:hypothetical protein
MADRPNYVLDENPVYTEEIPEILDSDVVSASKVVNPLITTILNNQKATHKLATDANGAAADALPASQKGAANGVASLNDTGKIPKSQLPTTGGYVRQATAPSDTSLLWMDSANGDIMKYYNGTAWVPQPSVWG